MFGNALKNGATNYAAYTNNGGSYSHDFVDYNGTVVTSPYIEAVSGAASRAKLSIADTNGIFTDISIVDGSPCRYLQFKVNSIPATGANGVLSIMDSSSVIMWSWHIWVWADSLATVEITNSTGVKYNIMPVNLASKYDSDGVHIKNWHYQFGRPNPMLCPSAYNSTSNHDNYGALNPGATTAATNIQTGIKNPVTFFRYSSSHNYNWFQTNSDKTYNLWDAACRSTGNSDNNVVKTIYDPSPIGFKMPNGKTFTGLSIISEANGIVKLTRYSGDSTGVRFPLSGYRDSWDSLLQNVGSYGYVWLSSAYSQENAYISLIDPRIGYASGYSDRASGFSVRPVAEKDIDIQGQNKRTKIRIDQTITDPEAMITRIVDLGGIEAIRANSHRYTGTFADGKMTLKQLNDVNGTKYVDGTAADLTTIGTDVWMKLPQFHWKCTEHATDVWDFEVVYGAKPDDTYKTWDGNDLIGAYEAYNSSNKLYSVSEQVSTSSVSQANFKTYAHTRGEGFSLVKWKHHCMMAMLYYTMYGHTNCQNNIGKGASGYLKATGVTNSLGMTDTVAGGNGDSNSINFWGLENWWGNKFEFIDNVVVDARVWKVTEDDGTVRQAGTGGYISGFMSKLLFGENIDLIPMETDGSATTGFCDYYYQSSSNSRVVYRSNAYDNVYGGVAFVGADSDSSNKSTSFGSRLAFRGDIVIES